MRRLLGTLTVATIAIGTSALSAHADTTISCPLPQVTRTIIDSLPPGWSTDAEVNPVTNNKVDTSSGQQVLVCEYGSSGTVQRVAPFNQNCTKIPGRKFKCVSAPPPPPPPPPGPMVTVVSQGPLTLADNGTAELDAGGPPDIRLRADNPFLRTLDPVSGASLSPQGTHQPSFADCQSAPYSPAPILQTQLPVGVWLCVNTSDGNFGRIRITNIMGVPGLPLPMVIYLDHTTWAASSGGGGGGQPVHASTTVVLPQTYSIDLDEGQITSGPQADLWFQAVTAVQLFLKPMNGAQLAVGNKSNRGYDGCAAEAFSSNAVPLNMLPVGSYICAATNQGRVSQFRIVGITGGMPKKLSIAITTWE